MKKSIAFIMAVLLMLVFISCDKNTENASETIYTVNGYEITENEINYFKTKFRAQVLNDYLEKYDIEYSESFWQTDFDGVTPQKSLDEKALKESALAKIQFELMEEEGIYEDTSYSALYEKAENFNKENENKEGVVGLKSIQMAQFYTYYLENGIMELKNIYAEGKLKPSEKELNDEIENTKAELSDSDRVYSDEEIENVAKGRLEETKYKEYIDEIYNKSEIKKVEKDG